ncbi:uncharacterized protein LOC118205756, partial [Stegodyphus dumicola]|uniref:uncharacterized protein LOC118205756 n=1 Tax=Stegodyphus dumicola TaxID=202533 RepID=UPI0015AD6BAC
VNIAGKDPESWRLTIFKKLFYINWYYYLDEDSIKGNLVNILRDYLSHHLNLDYIGNLEGHIVKVFIPSSYHTKAVSKIVPVPVGFEITNPLLLSLKIKAKKAEIESPQGLSYSLSVRPSVHHSILHSNQILDLHDCKHIGVYHEKKISASYPIELKLAISKHGNLSLAYSFPELPKKILSYHSESGTYAAKWDGETPLSLKPRKSIQTIPIQFKREKEIGVLGLPKFHVKVLTEDIKEGREEIPRNQQDLARLLIRKLLNAGWRKKTVEIERVADSKLWPSRAEVQLNVSIEQNFVEQSILVRDEDWAKKVNLRDKLEAKNPKDYPEEAKVLVKLLDEEISHMNETLIIDLVQISNGRIVFALHLNASYRYTFGGCLQHLHVNTDLKQHRHSKRNEASLDFFVAFLKRPHEFSYDREHFGKQKAVAYASLSLPKSDAFENATFSAKALLAHRSLEDLLHNELLSPKLSELYLPKTHKQCIHDVRHGNSLSVACVKAIKEASIYNSLDLDIIWRNELPPELFDLLIKVELAAKFAFFPHLEVEIKKGVSKVRWPYLRFHSIIIDKLVDKPVADIVIEKPDEILKFHKVELGPIQPISCIEPLVDTYFQAYSNNTYPVSCIITEKQVKTYDAKVYQLPENAPEHTYIVSAHSIEHKKFAVLAKIRPGSNAVEEIQLFIGADVIVLIPPSRHVYNLKHNEVNVPIRLLKSKVLNWEEQIHAFVYPLVDGNVVLEVHAHVAGVRVTYDGKNLKLKIHPRYKGELSGLCSEFDGDVLREFVGVDGCLYSNSDDFVKSAIVDSDADRTPEHPVICDQDEILHRTREKQYSPRMRRNLVLAKGEELCFSVKPVPMCDNQASPQQTKQENVKFHCLPKRDVAARRMVTEAKRRILGELEAKSADLTQTVNVAKMC